MIISFNKRSFQTSLVVKNSCLNSSVANTDRTIISKTNHLEENLDDANRVFENSKECNNAFQAVQNRLQGPKNVVIGHLNVNSLRNKFEAVGELEQNKVDICFLSETKIDETFPNQQFMINGYSASYSTETGIIMVEVFYVILMKISLPKL